MTAPKVSKESDPGVPEAIPRTLIRLRDHLGVDRIDRLWIFPPVRRGRRERGLIAVSTFQDHSDRRGVVTVAYSAEHTGRGITIEPTFAEEGEAPPDRFPPVMQGVVRRSGEGPDPREVEIDGSGERFEELMEGYDDVYIEVPEP